MNDPAKRASAAVLSRAPQVVRDALVALWTDRRSDKHAELYAEAMQTLEGSAPGSESPTPPKSDYREALAEIETLAFRQYVDWMHFHELAMAKPFEAEAEAQGFANRISSLATTALGEHSGIEVVGDWEPQEC